MKAELSQLCQQSPHGPGRRGDNSSSHSPLLLSPQCEFFGTLSAFLFCFQLCFTLCLCPLRLAQSRTNPQVLDTGLTAQDMQSAETLSPVDWNKMDPGTAEKDDLFMF